MRMVEVVCLCVCRRLLPKPCLQFAVFLVHVISISLLAEKARTSRPTMDVPIKFTSPVFWVPLSGIIILLILAYRAISGAGKQLKAKSSSGARPASAERSSGGSDATPSPTRTNSGLNRRSRKED